MEVTDLDEYNEAISGSCVVKFTASWCGPCKKMAPVFESLRERYSDYSVRFLSIDIDKADAITDKENISSIPSFLIYHRGEAVPELHVVGANAELLQANIKALCDGMVGAPTITMAVDDVFKDSNTGEVNVDVSTGSTDDSSEDSSGESESSEYSSVTGELSPNEEVNRIVTPRLYLSLSSGSDAVDDC